MRAYLQFVPSSELSIEKSQTQNHLSAKRSILRSPTKTTLPYREVLMTFGTVKCTSTIQCSEVGNSNVQNRQPV